MGKVKTLLWFIAMILIFIYFVFVMVSQNKELAKWENFARDFYYDEYIISPIDDKMSYENLKFRECLFHYGKREHAYNIWWRNDNKSNEAVSLWYNIEEGVGALSLYDINLNTTKEYKFEGEVEKFINHTSLPLLRK